MKLKTIIKAASFAAAAYGVFDLALSKSQEKKGDFSREFPEIQDGLKQAIKDAGGKINE